MKLIPLTQGQFAQVDDEDYDFLMQWKWYANKKGARYRALRNEIGNEIVSGKRKTILMHRFILGVTDPTIEVDHADHDTLNNQRVNLRKATGVQNRANREKKCIVTSKYLGVCYDKSKNRWSVQIGPKKIGVFPYTPCGEILAAISYDIAAVEKYGEFANPNFKL